MLETGLLSCLSFTRVHASFRMPAYTWRKESHWMAATGSSSPQVYPSTPLKLPQVTGRRISNGDLQGLDDFDFHMERHAVRITERDKNGPKRFGDYRSMKTRGGECDPLADNHEHYTSVSGSFQQQRVPFRLKKLVKSVSFCDRGGGGSLTAPDWQGLSDTHPQVSYFLVSLEQEELSRNGSMGGHLGHAGVAAREILTQSAGVVGRLETEITQQVGGVTWEGIKVPEAVLHDDQIESTKLEWYCLHRLDIATKIGAAAVGNEEVIANKEHTLTEYFSARQHLLVVCVVFNLKFKLGPIAPGACHTLTRSPTRSSPFASSLQPTWIGSPDLTTMDVAPFRYVRTRRILGAMLKRTEHSMHGRASSIESFTVLQVALFKAFHSIVGTRNSKYETRRTTDSCPCTRVTNQ
ncbi:hypothetical protein BXZ70DRAFT_1016395 [Cristinia sonorae]|uniref:Uncharacterized protein n=1 Tax=Cristinia sonorae TaxID=1940300 RepID=A0A8K0XRE4_9AGAR|nr:hypothetical protein BXZ70DRAFT_1016395 [Cristinia sonorae]